MKRLLYIVFILPAFTTANLSAQSRVEIYADTTSNDSLRKLVTIFTAQLQMSLPATEFIVAPACCYEGKGIWMGLDSSRTSPVTFPSKLKTAGVEAFSINANGTTTVQILGNSNMAVSHGVFAWLHSIGFRFYFPNKEWHIIPSNPTLFKKQAVVSAPAFDHRRIWYGYGTGSKLADADYWFWVQANRLGGSMNAYFGHAYGNIIARNRAEFADHPEWFYPVAKKGNTTYTGDEKFDVSNEELIQLLIKDTEEQIEQSLKKGTQLYKMISMGPSDGVGTCNSPACQKLGTTTDRVYYAVNRVAKAIRKKYPSTLIGCLAYADYIAPPTKKVEPNVFVGITTAFNSSKFTTDELIDGWKKKGAIVGIYDYFSWYAWDFDIPGQSLASQTTNIINNIKKYKAKGVSAYEGESSQGWISKGLGYYLAAMTMWDVNSNTTSAKNEFFKNCFLKAAPVMEKLWGEWEKYTFKTVRENDLARWIDYLYEAEKLEKNAAVGKRLFQVKSYLHYLALYRIYRNDNSETNLFNLLSYGYRKVDDGSIGGYPSLFVLGNGSGIAYLSPYNDNPKWRSNATPVTEEELNKSIANDRRLLKTTLPVKQFAVAAELTTVPNIEKYKKLYDGTNVWEGKGWWRIAEWVIQVKSKGENNFMEYSGNHNSKTPDVKAAKIKIYKYTPDGNIEGRLPVFSYEYNLVEVKQKISLASLSPGFYTVIIDDPIGFNVGFSPSINFSQVFRPSRVINSATLPFTFIYVPEGVITFNVIKNSLLDFITPTGRKLSFPDKSKQEELQIEVLNGEAGLWRVRSAHEVFFEGIPPFISTSATQMLIPANIK